MKKNGNIAKGKAVRKRKPKAEGAAAPESAAVAAMPDSPPPEPGKVKVKKAFTSRFYMMLLSAGASLFGLGLFVLYFKTTNIIIGIPGVVMMVAGIFLFRHYWKKEDNITTDTIGGKKVTTQFNSLIIRKDRIDFEDMAKPEGFPMQCLNDNKNYYVMIEGLNTQALKPFILPDQQYIEPIEFAQRVLGLPAHRKIFERKPKLMQKLKTALLVVAIAIVWILIMTTTGGS